MAMLIDVSVMPAHPGQLTFGVSRLRVKSTSLLPVGPGLRAQPQLIERHTPSLGHLFDHRARDVPVSVAVIDGRDYRSRSWLGWSGFDAFGFGIVNT